jgi:hypothetical protein
MDVVAAQIALEVSAAPWNTCNIECRAEHHVRTFALIPAERPNYM